MCKQPKNVSSVLISVSEIPKIQLESNLWNVLWEEKHEQLLPVSPKELAQRPEPIPRRPFPIFPPFSPHVSEVSKQEVCVSL